MPIPPSGTAARRGTKPRVQKNNAIGRHQKKDHLLLLQRSTRHQSGQAQRHLFAQSVASEARATGSRSPGSYGCPFPHLPASRRCAATDAQVDLPLHDVKQHAPIRPKANTDTNFGFHGRGPKPINSNPPTGTSVPSGFPRHKARRAFALSGAARRRLSPKRLR